MQRNVQDGCEILHQKDDSKPTNQGDVCMCTPINWCQIQQLILLLLRTHHSPILADQPQCGAPPVVLVGLSTPLIHEYHIAISIQNHSDIRVLITNFAIKNQL